MRTSLRCVRVLRCVLRCVLCGGGGLFCALLGAFLVARGDILVHVAETVVLEQNRSGIGGFCAFAQPVFNTVFFDIKFFVFGGRNVVSDQFLIFPFYGVRMLGDNNAEAFLGGFAGAGETNS